MSDDTDDDAPVSFLVTGQLQATTALRSAAVPGSAEAEPAAPGTLKVSVRVGAARAGGSQQRVTAVPGEDVVALHIAGGPVLLLHPHNARDLMRAQAGGPIRGGAAPASDDIAVPAQLGWPGLEQAGTVRAGGWAGRILVTAFEIFTAGKGVERVADLAASAVVARVDGQVEAGVYGLSPDHLPRLKGSGRLLRDVPAAGEPMLVLLHGTFVDTAATFGKLWATFPDRVRALFAHYGGRVYALDHPTLGASPIANALTLAQALPRGARLHLATHSRGGLVAEVLARVCGSQGQLAPADLARFAGPGHELQRRELQELARLVRDKGLRVERVVRVACPARGTLLASKRLDAYLSVLKWALEATGLAVLPALVDLVGEVARRRAEPGQLPGLAAMMPGAPLVEWLNGHGEAIPGELRVIAGDLQGDSIGSWLKTLLADAYYWTDNDIVVQTRSMYGGTPRQGGALFLLDRGGKVTHFNYFANERSVQAVLDGLTEAQPAGFGLIGPLSWAGEDSSGLRAAARSARSATPAAQRPALFVLPGILGSHLKAGGQRIWLSLRLVGGLDRLAWAGTPGDVLPDGPIGMVYDDLLDHLAATHEVIAFAYDWRRPIEEEARRLADAVAQALDARQASGQPVRLLAHSMGGVVARTMQLERPQVWDRLMAHPDARLLMLGTPNGGSWAPMQVLSGDDTFGNALAAFGSPLANQRARQIMASFPGFLQLQAGLLDPALDLGCSATWQRLADDDLAAVQRINWWHHSAGEAQEPAYRWGVPPQPVLDAAVALRRRLDAQLSTALPACAARLCLVVGQAPQTAVGFEIDDRGLAYRDAVDAGDGRVPLASALLPGVKTWRLNASHGDLPSKTSAFDAFVELLQTGDTVRLARLESAAAGQRGAATPTLLRSRPSRSPAVVRPAGTPASVFALPAPDAQAEARGGAEGAPSRAAALRVAVLNGNLSFIAQPLLVGHYAADALSGTEAVVDRLIGGAMSMSLAAGLYPEAVGTQQVFVNTRSDPVNPWQPPRPRSVIVVGLGGEGALHAADIVTSVRQGALAWAQRVAEDPQQAGATIELAATLVGSGGMGISAAASATAVARGVHEANQRLLAGGWPVIGRLTLVELYLDRAGDAWQGLRLLAAASPQAFALDETIASGTGPLRRQLDGGYRGANYDLIVVTAGDEPDSLAYTVDTRRARTELRAQKTQGRLLREMIGRAATDEIGDATIGRTLFQLLVPVELEGMMGGTERMVLELDAGTAPIPWELLDTGRRDGGGEQRPWALRTQLLRRLRKSRFRSQPRDAGADDAVLVIGDPPADPAVYPRLPGARAEAEAVLAQLTGPGALDASRVKALLGDAAEAGAVIGALLARPYRIVHIAGHGEAPAGPGQPGGVVLSGGLFLGPHEIASMRTVPELVFVNCCHLAAMPGGQVLRTPDPAAFAAGVASELIAIGVRCVVAAGWAVDDEGAELFAAAFYRTLLAGRSFMSAVAAGREAAWQADPAGKTWAAYQCYGDPDWTYRSGTGDAQGPAPALHSEFDAIASPVGLTLALEEMVTRTRWMGARREAQRDRLLHLEARFSALWGDIGAVAEAYGLAWNEVGDAARALAWYQRALQANDGSASLKAQEQALNLAVRVAAAQALQAAQQAPATAAAAVQAARATIDGAVLELQHLCARQPTLERLSLLGSACKRLGLLEQRHGAPAAASRAWRRSLDAYRRAEALAAQARPAELFYPALNRMALESVLGGPRRRPWDRVAAEAVRASLLRKVQTDPDFWSHAGLVELSLHEAAATGWLAARAEALDAGFVELHARVQAPWLWASVAEQTLFALGPMLAGGALAERRAAASLLRRLGGLAWRTGAELEAWEQAVAQASGTAATAPPQATPARAPARGRGRAPQAAPAAAVAATPPPGADNVDAVVWHAPAEAKAAAAVAATLAAQGLRVWLRQQVARAADRRPALELALQGARLALVVLGGTRAPHDEQTLSEWSVLQEAAWRRDRPVLLATVAPSDAGVPAFLQQAPRLDGRAAASDPAVLQRLLAQLPDAGDAP